MERAKALKYYTYSLPGLKAEANENLENISFRIKIRGYKLGRAYGTEIILFVISGQTSLYETFKKYFF